MENELGKVTCIITRERDSKKEILLIKHPSAGIQFPVGTVELNGDASQAALREAYEETGIEEFLSSNFIGKQEMLLSGKYTIFKKAKVYSRPDASSFQWAEFRRGISVFHERRHGEYIQVSYKEGDTFPKPNYITYQITGWVEESKLATKITRYFYHLKSNSNFTEWEIQSDHHTFQLFWSTLDQLPQIVTPQEEWLKYVVNELNYAF